MVLLLLDPKVMAGQGLATIADVLFAACWITGEYASFLEGICEGEDDEEEEDDENDEAKRHQARIRAIPTEDLCLKIIDSLIHPRVTNLPAHVQIVYLLNALKVFVHACKHVPADELERIVTLLDERTHVFMQSVHVEVQERATSFRQLLIAFAIISPDAAAAVHDADADASDKAAESTASAMEPEPAKTANLIGDLLNEVGSACDVGEISVSASAGPLSSDGAVNVAGGSSPVASAKSALPMMEAILADKMVPVNPKAQSRVPLPEGLDLSLPIDDEAVSDFLTEEEPASEELAKVSFTGIAFVRDDEDSAFPDSNGGGSGFSAYHDGVAADDDAQANGGSAGGGASGGGPPAMFASYDRHDPHDPFYLSRSVHPNEVNIDDVPVIRLTAEDLEGDYDPKKRRKGSKREKKRKDKGGKDKGRPAAEYNVDTEELMPAGAVSSDEEKRRKKKADATSLADVDITTPLREDEIMPKNEHRIVDPFKAKARGGGGDSATEGAAAEETVTKSSKTKDKSEKRGKKEKKTSKVDKSSKTKEKKSSAVAAPNDSSSLIDLLDMGSFGAPSPDAAVAPPPAAAPPSAPAGGADALGFDMLGAATADSKPEKSKSKKDKKSKSGEKEKDKGKKGSKRATPGEPEFWSTVTTKGAMRVESRTVGQVASRQATVVVRVKNASPSELLSTVTVAVKEVPDGLKPAQTAPLTLAATLAAGATAEAPLPFGLTGNVERSLTVGVTISWLLEGLVPENVNIEGRLTLPACAFLKPTPISPEAFSGLLSSNTWHSSSARCALIITLHSQPVSRALCASHAVSVSPLDAQSEFEETIAGSDVSRGRLCKRAYCRA